MTKKSVWLAVLGMVMLSSAILFVGTQNAARAYQPAVVEHNLLVKKVNNQWKVVDAADTTKTRVTARRGEKIVWTAQGSDLYFQFMDQNLFGQYTRTLKDGQKLVLAVGNSARLGANQYAVFCAADNEYATGNSPPEVVIE